MHLTRAAGALVLMLIALALAIPGCTTNKLIRSSNSICTSADPDTDCPTDSIQHIKPPGADASLYSLGFVEVDDQGQLRLRAQMNAVLKDIEDLSKKKDEDYISVVFVHGWKHGATPHDGNIETFRSALDNLAKSEQALGERIKRPARKVVGIYIGWRGESLNVNYLDNLTFWERKNTAHKVGHGAVTEILARLDRFRRQKDASTPGGRSRSRLIVIGHSFGGAIVYSALGQLLEARFIQPQDAPPTTGNVEGFGNLVVLINPAFEAGLFSSLSDMALEKATYQKSQLPVLAILTSEADDATKVAFPLGRRLSTAFEKERKTDRYNPISNKNETIDEHDTNVEAVGHYAPYQTHYLMANDANLDVISKPGDRSATSVLGVAKQWEDDAPGSEIQFPGAVLKRSLASAGRNPYLVIKVDKKLIHDHNDLSNPSIAEFIGHLILVSSQSQDISARTRESSPDVQ
jgi:hypothetical protein